MTAREYAIERRKKRQDVALGAPDPVTGTRKPVNDTGGSNPVRSGGISSARQYAIERNIRRGSTQQQDNDFKSWLGSIDSFSKRMSDDYAKREGTYQAPAAFKQYRESASGEIADLLKQAYTSRSYYTQYGGAYDEVYGAGSGDSFLSGINSNIEYLEGIRKNLHSESDWWEQFTDENAYNDYRRISGYAELPKSADFGEKSQYVSTYQPGTEKFNAWSGTYSNSGFGDINYDYINRDETARNRQVLSDLQSNASLLGLDNSERGEMTDDEIATFNYLYATKGGEVAYQYVKDITSELNYRQRQTSEAEWAAYANEHPVGSSVFSVLESPLKGLSYLGQLADYTEDGAIDQNEGYNKFSYLNSAIRGEVAETIKNSGKWGEVGSVAYGYGMSMADFLFNTAITGGNQALTLGIMGTGAAADMTIAAKDRGLSDGQSFALGTIAGAAEVITEKFSLDALFNTNWEQGAIKYILKNAFVEGSEEVGSDVINLVADVLIAKDKSEWQLSIDAYKAQGYSDAEALGRAVGDQAMNMGLDFLGGAVSGGVMSGGSSAINAAGTYQTGKQFSGMDLGVEDIQAFIDEGLASDPSTQAYKLATQAQQKLQAGGTLTNYELGNLYQANTRAIGMEEDGAAILTQAAQDVATGKRVSNRTASSILDTPSAIGTLTRDAGLVLTDDMSKSQRREAVRSAVNGLARPGAAVSDAQVNSTIPTTQSAQSDARQAAAPSLAQRAWSNKRLADAITTLGPQGQVQAQAFYNGQDQRADEYYGGFSAYYEAGMAGMDIGKVRGQYASIMNDAQRQAAYLAGQNDAAAALAAEKERVQYATVYGEEAGLIQNDHIATLPQTQAVYLNNLGKALGAKIEMVDTVEHGGNGAYYTAEGTIRIAANAKDPAMVVAAHEITHRLQDLAPEAYRKYRDYTNRKIAEQVGRDAVEEIKDRYARNGVNLTTEQAMDEVAAEFTEAMVKDEKLFKDLAQDDRSVARKVLDAIRDFISKVRAAFKGNVSAQNSAAMEQYGVDMATLEESARLWNEALKEASAEAKNHSVVGTTGGYAQVDGKFSLKGVVEDNGELVALHNMTEKNLRDALELGGLPMPSIAIVKAQSGHAKYGPISIVFNKETIDPKASSKNKVYGGDAYTPTAPRVDRVLNDNVRQKVSKEIYDLAQQTAGGMFSGEASSILYYNDDYTSDTMDDILDTLSRNAGVQAAYLADQGKTLEPVMREKANQYDSFGNESLIDLKSAVGEQELASMDVRIATGEGLTASDITAVKAAIRGALERRPGGFSTTPEQRAHRIELRLSKLTAERMETFVRNAWDYCSDGTPSTEQEVDRYATKDALEELASEEQVRVWIAPKLEGLLGEVGIYNGKDPYTPSGNRKGFKPLHNAYTLENIVKAMASQQSERGEATWGVTAKTIQSVATPSYKSVKEIKADSGRLGAVDNEAYKAQTQAVDEKISEIIQRVKDGNKAHSDNPFTESDIIGDVMMTAAKSAKTMDAIMRKFSAEGYTISSQTAQDIQAVYKAAAELPTEYFEAKPQRAVGFGEVLAAVVPDDMDAALRDRAEKAGMRVLPYKAGDDADRLARVNSVEGARFSLKEKSGALAENMRALEEENELLRDRVEYWRGQTRRTARVTTDKKAVAKAARELIRSTGANLDAEDIAGDLQGLYDYIASGKDGKDELTYTEARARAEDIARRLVENTVAVDDDLYRQYGDLRDFLRTTKLTISEADSRDIADYGDFRKRNFGRLNLGKGGTNIDQAYQEMAELWPEFFDEQKQSHPADQLLHIEEVLDGIYDISEYNPFSYDMRQATVGIANEVMEQFFDLPQTRASFADRQAGKLDDARAKGRERIDRLREEKNARIAELRQQNRARVKEAIARERATAGRKLETLKQRYDARDQAGRARRSARELRAKIQRHIKGLSQKLLRPSDKQHIPEELRGAVAAMLEAINLESQYSIDQETGKRSKNAGGDPTKRTEAFRELREQYEAIAKGRTDFNGVLDPDLLDNLGEVIAMKDVRLADMSAGQLTTVWHVVKAVEQSVSTANKLLGKSRFEGVEELAFAIRQSSATKKAKGNWSGPTGWGDRLLNMDMMNPLTFLHLFGDGGDALYRELQAARDNRTLILSETVDLAQKVIGKADVAALREKVHTFQVEGGELKLTTAQLMSLYELSKREQAQDHIYKGGIRATANESGVSREKSAKENLSAALGKLDAPSAGVKVTQGDMATMLSTLTEEEVNIADGLQHIMEDYLAQQGNQESMRVYGYQKFTERNYFPISSDPHQTIDKIGDVLEGGEKRPRSIAEWGSAKGTMAKANNGLLLGGIFDVFAQHAVDMATYASHLGAMEDMNRVRNFTFRDGEGSRIGTMGDIIQRVAGQGGDAYLNKLLQDVSAGTAKGGVTGLAKLTANYKAASVGMNLRVALQQPTSYLRAAAAIHPKYLADPRVLKRNGWSKALKNAPIAQWKDWGNFEINQGRQIQNIMFDTDSKLDRWRSFSMKLAGAMDSLTWGRIWNACELEVADTRPELARGGADFMEAVAQRFTDIIDQTQVVDNVLGRSQIMRSSDALAKMATSYMGEPTQSYNLVYRSFRDWSQEQDSAKRTAAKKHLGAAVLALTASQFVNAIAQALWDAVRDDDDRDEKYWERVLGHILPNFADNANPLGMVPYLKDILSVLQGYEVKRMDMAAITSFISACQNMGKAIGGEGRYTLAGASANLIAEAARIFGLPVATVKRDLVAVARSVGVETGDWYFQYQLEKALNSVGYSGNRGEFYDIAFSALENGELDVYQRIARDLAEQGVKPGTIESAMRERLKKALEQDPDFALGQDAKDLIGSRDSYDVPETEEEDGFAAGNLGAAAYQRYATQRASSYREMVDALEGYDSFHGLDNETKNKALGAAYTLADKLALAENSDGKYEADTKWMVWATGGADHGVDETEAILFKTAYDMTEGDKDEEGKTVSGSKKENTLEAAERMMPWLTEEELDYLKSNYWKD